MPSATASTSTSATSGRTRSGSTATAPPRSGLTAYRATSYCALDDDFSTSQFPGTPRGNLEVTAAHEFFHAVQFGIDYTEDGFFLENSSTWIEDEIFDAVDDNRNYLDDSALAWPGDPLDLADNWYGNWIWLRFLTERFPEDDGTGLPVLVKQAWDRTDDSAGSFSVRALAEAVAARGGQLPRARRRLRLRQPVAGSSVLRGGRGLPVGARRPHRHRRVPGQGQRHDRPPRRRHRRGAALSHAADRDGPAGRDQRPEPAR